MTVTKEPDAPRKVRTKGEQIVDIIANMTPNQLVELARVWTQREPEHFNRFQRAAFELAKEDPNVVVRENEA